MALKEALFVSEEKLKSFTSVNNNVSPLDLTPYILQSQEIYLQAYIGATFYFQLKEQVLTGTVDAPNKFILDNYIGQMICNFGLMMALPFLKYKVFNKSVLSPTSENAESINLDELKFLQEQCKSTAEFYAKRLLAWMTLHPGDYPKYITPNVLDGLLPDRGNPYNIGLITPHQPYAYKRRIAYNSRDMANLGYYDNGMGCLECGPNSVSPNNV